MSPPSIHLLEHLHTADLTQLTSLLRLPPTQHPTTAWLSSQATLIDDLPPTLQKPKSLLLRLGMSLSSTDPDRAILCPSHKNLNPYLIHRIFIQVLAECTTRLNRLVSYPFLTPEIGAQIRRMATINSLWMSSALFTAISRKHHPSEERFSRITSNCEACILSSIGGNPHVLCDLRISMLGRKKKGRKEPRLLRVVEEWIRHMSIETREDVNRNSDHLAREVRKVRKAMQLARRQTRREYEDGVGVGARSGFGLPFGTPPMTAGSDTTAVAEDGMSEGTKFGRMEDGDEDEDPEGEIISHYARSMYSREPLLQQDIHPAFRDSFQMSGGIGSGDTLYEEDIHPAFRNSIIPPPAGSEGSWTSAVSTSYASFTNTAQPSSGSQDPNRLSVANLRRLNDLPPRPTRPQNRSLYADSLSTLHGEMSHVSAIVPPLKPSPHVETAYTESIYSRDVYGRTPRDEQSTMIGYARRSAEEQAGLYQDVMRRVVEDRYGRSGDKEEEVQSVPDQPLRRRDTGWNDGRRRPRQSGW